jgi:hypothetical protein
MLVGPTTAEGRNGRVESSSAAILIAKSICVGSAKDLSWKAVAFADRWEVSAMPKDSCAPRPSISIPRDGRSLHTRDCRISMAFCDPPPASVEH